MKNSVIKVYLDHLWYGILVWGVVTLLAAYSKADDSDYYQAKARAALALHNTATTTEYILGVPVSPIPQVEGVDYFVVIETDGHPELKRCLKPMTMHYTTWCKKCPEIKYKLGLDPLRPNVVNHDFVFRLVDETDKEQPDWVESFPYFTFNTPDGKLHYLFWEGLEKLKARYQKTFEIAPVPPRAKAGSPYPSFKGYNPRWTWPGDLRTHLRCVHGIGEAFSLSQDQAEALHDALHEGHSASKIRNYYRKKG